MSEKLANDVIRMIDKRLMVAYGIDVRIEDIAYFVDTIASAVAQERERDRKLIDANHYLAVFFEKRLRDTYIAYENAKSYGHDRLRECKQAEAEIERIRAELANLRK